MPRTRNGKPEGRSSEAGGKVATRSAGVKDKPKPKTDTKPRTGGTRKVHSVTESVRVGRQIVLMRHAKKPMTWPAIVKELGVPRATAIRLYERALEVNALHDERQTERVIDHSLAVIEEVIEESATLAAGTANEAIKLGALRQVASYTVTKIELLAGLGRLPVRSDESIEEVATAFFEKLAEALDQYELPAAFRDRVTDLNRQVLPVIEGRVLTQRAGE